MFGAAPRLVTGAALLIFEPMTAIQLLAKDFANAVRLDPIPETVNWDVDSYFTGVLTPLENSLDWQQGGAIENVTTALHVPAYTCDAVTGLLTAQFDDGRPAEGDILQVQGLPRRVARIENSQDGAGWVYFLEGPD